MTLDEAVAQIQQIMGFRQDLAAVCATNIKLAQDFYEQNWADLTNLPYFLLTDRTDLATIAGDEKIARPANWLGDAEKDEFWLTNADGVELLLPKYDIDDLRETYGTYISGQPIAYGFDGTNYRLFPTPDIAYVCRFQYFATDTVLSSGSSTNKWLTFAPYVLIGRAGKLICGSTKDGRMSLFDQMLSEAIEMIARKSIYGLDTNRQYKMGENF
jgi:hypothetical protein